MRYGIHSDHSRTNSITSMRATQSKAVRIVKAVFKSIVSPAIRFVFPLGLAATKPLAHSKGERRKDCMLLDYAT